VAEQLRPTRRWVPVLTTLIALAACEKAPPPGPGPAPTGSSEEDLRAERAERAVAEALASVRSRLSLAAPAWQLQPLATGRRLLVRLTGDAVEAFSTPDVRLAFAKPLEAPCAVVAVAGGSVVAVGRTETFRVDPGAKAPVVLPPLVYTPGTLLLPERRDSTVLFNAERTTRSLFRQPLVADPKAPRVVPATLEGYDGGPVTMLRDGAVLYRASDGVRRGMPGGRSHVLRGGGLTPWRLLPGRRIDQAWAVAADGSVEHWQLTDRVQVLGRFALGAPPFDAASNETYLGAVVVEEGGSGPRRFLLRVFDEKGERVLERQLPPDPPARGEKWAAKAVEDRHVVLGDPEPIVAVGGKGSLQVWGLPAGNLLLQR
jgi:hypothetical protein